MIDGVEKSLTAAIQRIEHAGLESVKRGIFDELQCSQYAVQRRT
jgi:hypothetical protein